VSVDSLGLTKRKDEFVKRTDGVKARARLRCWWDATRRLTGLIMSLARR